MGENRQQLLDNAKFAEQAERYDDMAMVCVCVCCVCVCVVYVCVLGGNLNLFCDKSGFDG